MREWTEHDSLQNHAYGLSNATADELTRCLGEGWAITRRKPQPWHKWKFGITSREYHEAHIIALKTRNYLAQFGIV